MGRAEIPLDEVREVHVDEGLTTLGVQSPSRYVVQSIATPVSLDMGADTKKLTAYYLRQGGIEGVWHERGADVYRVAKSTSPFMYPGAIRGTLSRPLVWGCMLGWPAYGVRLSVL